ncbi:hypothetical protein JYU34_000085 [Plutella xylostella]|uniref:Uncharacterized protein n=1 Tax=Plutella xylostella TaxID=51655 RepID=A0ABQ7R6T6_PLUXY|nr:hypothetical protein JYU34_000085 [Plutella xylostella]
MAADGRKRSSMASLPAIEVLQRNVFKVPTHYSRKPRVIPFHLPHRKLLEKIEYTKEEPEPLTGFAAAQEERFKREVKPSRLQLEPLRVDENKKKQTKSKVVLIEEECPTEDPLKIKPIVASQNEVIAEMRRHPEQGFIYMIYVVPPENVYFTPYYLKVVPYDQIDKHNYFTLSPCGVTHYTNEMVFTKLDAWEQEYNIFVKLTEIKFFNVYRYWKAFYVWRKSILFRKFSKMRNKLAKNLFTLTPVLGKALLNIQAMCCEMYMKSFADVTIDMDTAFFYFIELQMKRVEIMRETLTEYRSVVLDLVTAACHAALYLQGFIYDDRNIPPFQVIRGRPTGGMSYTEKANKRKYCERLACFIKLVDYMTNYMLYRLTRRSNYMLAGLLRVHYGFTPELSLLQGTAVDQVLEAVPRDTDTCQWALFQVDAYVLPTGEVELNPSEKVISEYMDKITSYWDEFVRTFRNYLNDEGLQIFVQPTIMGKQVDWSAGVAPNLYFLMQQDKQLLDDIEFIPLSIKLAYESVGVFLGRMQGFMENFRDAHEKDVEEIRRERDLAVFRALAEQYIRQMDQIEELVSYQPLGLLFLSLAPFQELFRPQPRRLLDVITNVTPEIGHECIEEIVSGIKAVREDIDKEPETAAELVAFHFMLEDLEGRVAQLEDRLEYLRELYDMMAEFNMPVPPDDMTEYLGQYLQEMVGWLG